LKSNVPYHGPWWCWVPTIGGEDAFNPAFNDYFSRKRMEGYCVIHVNSGKIQNRCKFIPKKVKEKLDTTLPDFLEELLSQKIDDLKKKE